ncbi:MAG: cytochrome c biogenesis protein ResB, partial [Planctomycetes bacterium]|nr:cytochrome c biogenesis protein ResB [Planctomycetota bacterium]
DVIAIPGSLIAKAAETGQTIHDPDLPFDIQVLQYMKNSDLADPRPNLPNPATAGNGLRVVAVPQRGSTGTDMGRGVDMASAYVKLLDKKSGENLGTYLASQYLPSDELSERVRAGDAVYNMSLRFRRTYKPYTMHLIDVRKDDYIGTSTPRDYSSYVHLVDSARNIDRDRIRIWMNNPLRYAGETFYQSGYQQDPKTGLETTTLQVVTNTGWMIPYVACMLVAVGMFAHFWNILLRFLQRRARQSAPTGPVVIAQLAGDAGKPSKGKEAGRRERKQSGKTAAAEPSTGAKWLIPGVVALILLGWAIGKMVPRSTPSGEFNLVEFGKLPVVYEGRIKPMDTLARNALRKISDYETYRDDSGNKHSAVEWLLDVVARPQQAEQHRIFRIYNLDVLQVLGLERRRGFH